MKPAVLNSLPNAEVEVTRFFAAPVDQVWNAFSDADLVREWMLGPPGWSMPVCELDFCVGGEYRNVFRNEELDLEILISGTFREIDLYEKIVQDEEHVLGNSSDSSRSGTTVTIAFSKVELGTAVTTSIAYESEEARDEALATGMGPAMELGYQRIDNLLAA